MSEKQKTLKEEFCVEGIGLHSGLNSKILLKPALPNSGVVVKNANFPDINIKIGKVVPINAKYATVLGCENWRVSTLEHLMAALNGLGVDNVVIEVDGPEVPIMDGSAYPFVEKILKVGVKEQDARKLFLTPKELLFFEDKQEGKSIEIAPAQKQKEQNGSENNGIDKNLYIEYEADFNHQFIGEGKIGCCLTEDFFIKEIAPARTFGFIEELPFLKKNGLAKGASLENTLVIGENGYLNERRFEDEFVRHKLLDMIGDIGLLGKKLIGSVKAKKTGHSFNRLVIEHYVNNPEKWSCV